MRGVTFCARVRACVHPPPFLPLAGRVGVPALTIDAGVLCALRAWSVAPPRRLLLPRPPPADAPAAAVHRRVRARAERVRCGVKRGCGGRGATLRLRTARGRKAGA